MPFIGGNHFRHHHHHQQQHKGKKGKTSKGSIFPTNPYGDYEGPLGGGDTKQTTASVHQLYTSAEKSPHKPPAKPTGNQLLIEPLYYSIDEPFEEGENSQSSSGNNGPITTGLYESSLDPLIGGKKGGKKTAASVHRYYSIEDPKDKEQKGPVTSSNIYVSPGDSHPPVSQHSGSLSTYEPWGDNSSQTSKSGDSKTHLYESSLDGLLEDSGKVKQASSHHYYSIDDPSDSEDKGPKSSNSEYLDILPSEPEKSGPSTESREYLDLLPSHPEDKGNGSSNNGPEGTNLYESSLEGLIGRQSLQKGKDPLSMTPEEPHYESPDDLFDVDGKNKGGVRKASDLSPGKEKKKVRKKRNLLRLHPKKTTKGVGNPEEGGGSSPPPPVPPRPISSLSPSSPPPLPSRRNLPPPPVPPRPPSSLPPPYPKTALMPPVKEFKGAVPEKPVPPVSNNKSLPPLKPLKTQKPAHATNPISSRAKSRRPGA